MNRDNIPDIRRWLMCGGPDLAMQKLAKPPPEIRDYDIVKVHFECDTVIGWVDSLTTLSFRLLDRPSWEDGVVYRSVVTGHRVEVERYHFERGDRVRRISDGVEAVVDFVNGPSGCQVWTSEGRRFDNELVRL